MDTYYVTDTEHGIDGPRIATCEDRDIARAIAHGHMVETGHTVTVHDECWDWTEKFRPDGWHDRAAIDRRANRARHKLITARFETYADAADQLRRLADTLRNMGKDPGIVLPLLDAARELDAICCRPLLDYPSWAAVGIMEPPALAEEGA